MIVFVAAATTLLLLTTTTVMMMTMMMMMMMMMILTPMTTAEGVQVATMASGNVCCFVFATFCFSVLLKRFFSSAEQSQSRDLRHYRCFEELMKNLRKMFSF